MAKAEGLRGFQELKIGDDERRFFRYDRQVQQEQFTAETKKYIMGTYNLQFKDATDQSKNELASFSQALNSVTDEIVALQQMNAGTKTMGMNGEDEIDKDEEANVRNEPVPEVPRDPAARDLTYEQFRQLTQRQVVFSDQHLQ